MDGHKKITDETFDVAQDKDVISLDGAAVLVFCQVLLSEVSFSFAGSHAIARSRELFLHV